MFVNFFNEIILNKEDISDVKVSYWDCDKYEIIFSMKDNSIKKIYIEKDYDSSKEDIYEQVLELLNKND